MQVTRNNKKALNFEINDLEALAKFICNNNKTFRQYTEYTESKFNSLLKVESINYKILLLEIRKILEITGKGHPSKKNLIPIFGWTIEEVKEYEKQLSSRTQRHLLANPEIDPIEFMKMNSSFCKEYWIKRGYSLEEAEIKIHKIQSENSKKVKPESRILCSKSNIEYWIKHGYSLEEAEIKIKEFNESFKIKSKRCLEYWINEGYSEVEAKSMLSDYQRLGMNARLEKYSSEEFKSQINTCIEFYTSRGYLEEDAIEIISKRQNINSLNKYISRYGDIIGKEKFDNRQIRWLKTLSDKPQEEKDLINAKKSTKVNFKTLWSKELTDPGIFYLIRINSELTKIGITSKSTIFKRYDRESLKNIEYTTYNNLTISEAFKIEQILKKKFFNTIKKNDYGVFGWTEVLNTNYLDLHSSVNQLVTDKQLINEKFNETIKHHN